jgi:hypothetical protein
VAFNSRDLDMRPATLQRIVKNVPQVGISLPRYANNFSENKKPAYSHVKSIISPGPDWYVSVLIRLCRFADAGVVFPPGALTARLRVYIYARSEFEQVKKNR